MSEEDVELLRESAPGITEQCVEKFRFGGVEAVPQDVGQCFKMTPKLRLTGVWVNEFEGSRFCPHPEPCARGGWGNNTWLSFADATAKPEFTDPPERYKIDFIGRRTVQKGYFGHMGGFGHEVIVDEVISMSPIDSYSPSHR